MGGRFLDYTLIMRCLASGSRSVLLSWFVSAMDGSSTERTLNTLFIECLARNVWRLGISLLSSHFRNYHDERLFSRSFQDFQTMCSNVVHSKVCLVYLVSSSSNDESVVGLVMVKLWSCVMISYLQTSPLCMVSFSVEARMNLIDDLEKPLAKAERCCSREIMAELVFG